MGEQIGRLRGLMPCHIHCTASGPRLRKVDRWTEVIAPIGSPDEAIVSSLQLIYYSARLALLIGPRPLAANKGTFGHVLAIGGQ